MSVINATPLLAAAGGDYQISRSVRLRSSASAYFNRTPASAGSQTTWTWSGWVKRGALGASQVLFGASNASSSQMYLRFTSSDTLEFVDWATTTQAQRSTSAVYRDPSAHMHVVLQFDTTQAVASDRVRLYVNGAQVTAFSTTVNPSQNFDGACNSTVSHSVGREEFSDNQWFDGYLTEVNFIDGQALTPSSFGETDSITGVWKPKKYAGTYGTNGFYLNFSDNSAATAAAIGKDYSGNGNNWTPNNISVTAGVTYDSMIDVPTLYADGGNGRGNYAVLNPIGYDNATSTLNDGNLKVAWTAGGNSYKASTVGMTSGKWYCEFYIDVVSTAAMPGLINDISSMGYPGSNGTGNGYGYYYDGQKYTSGAGSAYGNSYTNGDIVGIAYDSDSGKLWFSKNGVWQASGDPVAGTNAAFTGLSTTRTWFFAAGHSGSATMTANFGQRPFAYTPPTGFKALNTQNLPEPTIKKGNAYFDATTYTGNGSALTVTNSGSMQPDLLWTKQRSSTAWNYLQDAVRGVNKGLFSNSTDAEYSITPTTTTLNSNGFSFNGSESGLNANGATYVAWQWKESATAGFDIVTYTGNGTSQNIAHSLGVAPKMMIIKNRGGTVNWGIYHASLGSGSPQNYVMQFDTAGQYGPSSTYWNGTAPTSSVFSVGSLGNVNDLGGNFVAYLFAEVAGFSKFGSYTGNGSADGPFVFCGFRPKYVLTKSATGVESWYINDSSMNPYNVTTSILAANTSAAEATGSWIDILSNGFKIRYNSSPFNTSGGTYIFAAFAENPFKNSLAR